VPLGLDSPFMMVDLDSFAAIAFEAAGEEAQERDEQHTISEADLVDDVTDPAPAPADSSSHRKLQSVLLGAFAAMSIVGAVAARKR